MDRADSPFKLAGPDRDHWRTDGDGTCSYCGSLNPTVFMNLAEGGELIVPTDKSYKAYAGRARRKFYFQHLDEAQRRRFVELLNGGQLQIAYPGRFYALPFFVTRTVEPSGPNPDQEP